MRAVALVGLLILAPEGVELRYRFPEGLVYEDTTEREVRVELLSEGKTTRWHVTSEEKLRRTILEADGSERPRKERVRVLRFVQTFHESPLVHEQGEKVDPAEGKTFIWQRLEERWGLFDEGGEVTARYPRLVERLKNWRDARLPKGPVSVGDRWEVPARTFVETIGEKVPEGLDGRVMFHLSKIDEGIATIDFRFARRHEEEGRLFTGEQKGVWRFDVESGRELGLSMKGEVQVDSGRSGHVKMRMVRRVRYR